MRHPRFVEYKLKYNIKYICKNIIQSDTTWYFIKLYYVIIPATCLGLKMALEIGPKHVAGNIV